MAKKKISTMSGSPVAATVNSLFEQKPPRERSVIEVGYQSEDPLVAALLQSRRGSGSKGLVQRTEELESRLVPTDGPLTKKQVMALCGFKVTKLGQLLRDGTLTRVMSHGKEVLISRASVDAYRQAQGHTGTPLPQAQKTKGRRRGSNADRFDLQAELKKLK